MTTMTLQNLRANFNFPAAQQKRVGLDYAQLTRRLRSFRADLATQWSALSEDDKAFFYGLAEKHLLKEPSWLEKAYGKLRFIVMALSRSESELAELFEYAHEYHAFLHDVLNWAENDSPVYQQFIGVLLGQAQQPGHVKRFKTKEALLEHLNTL
jgi:hypothetical protein